MKIYKYKMMPWVTTKMPKGAQVLSVAEQGEDMVVWASVDETAPLVNRDIGGIPTGGEAPGRRAVFIGTVQRHDGLVFHFFDFGERSDEVTDAPNN